MKLTNLSRDASMKNSNADTNHLWKFQRGNELVMVVPVPYKWDRSLITWDWSKKVESFGTGPITLIKIV